MKKENIYSIILEFIHSETGWGNPLRPHCEFEELEIKEINKGDEENHVVTFKYEFDEDGFSQYDKTHFFEGEVKINSNGKIYAWSLEEVHTGVAAQLYYGKKKQEEDKLKPLIDKLEKLQSQLSNKGFNREDYEKLSAEVDILMRKIENLKKNN